MPLYRRENTFQELDNLTWTKGLYTFKLGADFRRRQLTIYQTNEGNGRFNFSPAFTDWREPAGKVAMLRRASFLVIQSWTPMTTTINSRGYDSTNSVCTLPMTGEPPKT